MNLQLSLKKEWFELTKSGVKTEDYREINEYWTKRLFVNVCSFDLQNVIKGFKEGKSVDWASQNHLYFLKKIDFNIMTLGYPKSTDTERIIKLEHKGIEIRTGNPEWGAEPNKLYFVIKHGEIIKLKQEKNIILDIFYI